MSYSKGSYVVTKDDRSWFFDLDLGERFEIVKVYPKKRGHSKVIYALKSCDRDTETRFMDEDQIPDLFNLVTNSIRFIEGIDEEENN